MKTVVFIAITTLFLATTSLAETRWSVEPSLKYDALCFINILSGDEFYRKQYSGEYDRFQPQMNAGEMQAASRIRKIVHEKGGNVVPAFLCLYMPDPEPADLASMVDRLHRSDRLDETMKGTVYFDKHAFDVFRSVKNDLETMLRFLQRSGFESYWTREILPRVNERAKIIGSYLTGYDLVSEIEPHLGRRLASPELKVYALYFARPHGFRLAGNRFVTDISYPPDTELRIAIHELLHPPYDLKNDPELRKAIEGLSSNASVMSYVRNHDPAYGYNDLKGYVEEDCVRALDQLIGEKLGLMENADKRFATEDGGMHARALWLYRRMKSSGYEDSGMDFQTWLRGVLNGPLILPEGPRSVKKKAR